MNAAEMESVGADGVKRARGCLLGQLAGDSLGSLVEFRSPEQIRRLYPEGVRLLEDGGTWGTLAGQPTDDSEMALALARTLVRLGEYDSDAVRAAYVAWLESDPFDCGGTVAAGLQGRPRWDSQANGALMRVSPLGIFGAFRGLEYTARRAEEDAALTHPHPVCRQANALYAMAIAEAVHSGCTPPELYRRVVEWAEEREVDSTLRERIHAAAEQPPDDYVRFQGWVLIAFQNALWQLLHADSLESGVVDTVMRGGDTDTNAAICGALLGAVYGVDAVPDQWREAVLSCRPAPGDPRVRRPRPREYWPVDALDLADALVRTGMRRPPHGSGAG